MADFTSQPKPWKSQTKTYVELDTTDIPELTDERYAVLVYDVNTNIDADGNTKVNVENLPRTGFGEVNVAVNEPFIQAAPVYNLIPANFRQYTAGTGSTGAENHMFKVSTGVGVGGYGAIQSFRALNYKPGEGGLARFTGVFESSAANSWQGVGLINLGDELSFGFNGLDFGVWHRYGGVAETRTLTLTAAAGGAETLTLTLNDVNYDIPLTAGTTTLNAYEVEDYVNSSIAGWNADQVDNTVIISAGSDGAKTNSYSVSSTGTADGNIVQTTAGVTKTSDFVAQADWNGDTVTIDPTKGNVFQISYQYLGFGAIKYFVEDPMSGFFKLVHTIDYANNNTVPSLGNPSLRAGMYAVSLGSTDDLVVRSGSFGLFAQGVRGRTRNPRAYENTQNLQATFTNVLSIRNRRTYNGLINQVEISPDYLTIAAEGSKNVEVEIRANPTNDTATNFTAAGNNLVADVDTSGWECSTGGGRLLGSYVLAGGTSISINLKEQQIRLPPSLQLSVLARTPSGPAVDVSCSLSWYEDL